MMRLDGNTVLLTGALGSLGRAQAMHLAQAGARLLLLDRPNHAQGESFAMEVAKTNAISPGAVRSEAEDRVFGDRLQQYNDWVLDRQSLKERIFPEHIADLVLFPLLQRIRHDYWPEHSD